MGVTLPDVAAPMDQASVPSQAAWSGVIAHEGVFTGDGRKFDPQSLFWEDLPLPLRWAPEDFGHHDGARHVGWIEEITRAPDGTIPAKGTAFDQEFIDFLGQSQKIGVSIDPDMAEFDVILPPDAQPMDAVPQPGVPTPILEEQEIFHKARIRAATCVDIPAFIDAQIALTASVPVLANAGSLEINEALFADALETGVVTDTGTTRDDGAALFNTNPDIQYAGIALQAADTGNVLMIQRAHDSMLEDGSADPNAGLWEWPGGGLELNEDPFAAAQREFAEETGLQLPEMAQELAQHDSGPYRLHAMSLPQQTDIPLTSRDHTINPDNPDCTVFEAVAWHDPTHMQNWEGTRPEVRNNWPTSLEALAVAAPAPPVSPKQAPPVPPHTAPPSDEPPADEKAEQQVVDLLGKAQEAIRGYVSYPSTATPETLQALLDTITQASDLLNPEPGDTPTAQDAMIASAAPAAPPDEWFVPFELDGPTPLTVTADGRVFGHLASWDSCHRSGQYGGKCVTPPSDPKAPFFQMGQVLTASGATVDVGVVTVGGGHAAKNKGLIAALEHYDDVSSAAATVVVQEDAYGIGLFGSVVPDADASLVAALRRSPLSGDWRKEKGNWRLVAAHAVNTPGFPIPRGLVASVSPAAFLTHGRPEAKTADPNSVDLRAVAQRLARSAGLDQESLVASARAAMADVDCGCDETLAASVSGDVNLPIASYDLQWDGGQAAARVFDHFTTGTTVDTTEVAKAFLWRDESQPADQKSGYSLPFADIVDGELKVVPSGVQAAAGGHGVAQLNGASPQELTEIKSKISGLYAKIQSAYPDAPNSPYDQPSQPNQGGQP